MVKNPEKLIQRYLDHYISKWKLGRWKVTWEIVEKVDKSEDDRKACHASNTYYKRGKNAYKSHIKFRRASLTSPMAVRKLVIHELLHFYDFGMTPGQSDILIDQMEMVIIRTERREKWKGSR